MSKKLLATFILIFMSVSAQAKGPFYGAFALPIEDAASIEIVDINTNDVVLGYYTTTSDESTYRPFLYSFADGLIELNEYLSKGAVVRDLSDSGKIIATALEYTKNKDSAETDEAVSAIEIVDVNGPIAVYLATDFYIPAKGKYFYFTDAQFIDDTTFVSAGAEETVGSGFGNIPKVFWGDPKTQISFDLESGFDVSLEDAKLGGFVVINSSLRSGSAAYGSRMMNFFNDTADLPSTTGEQGSFTLDINSFGTILSSDAKTIFEVDSISGEYKKKEFSCRKNRKRKAHTLFISGLNDTHFVGKVVIDNKRQRSFAVTGKLNRRTFNCARMKRRYARNLDIEKGCKLTELVATNKGTRSVARGFCRKDGQRTEKMFFLEPFDIFTM